MRIPKENIAKLDNRGLESFIVDCMKRVCDTHEGEYREDQLNNALNGARQLKANELGITVKQLIGE